MSCRHSSRPTAVVTAEVVLTGTTIVLVIPLGLLTTPETKLSTVLGLTMVGMNSTAAGDNPEVTGLGSGPVDRESEVLPPTCTPVEDTVVIVGLRCLVDIRGVSVPLQHQDQEC